MSLVHYFMKMPSNAALFSPFHLKSSRLSKVNKKDESLIAYTGVEYHWLAIHATDGAIAGTVSNIHSFIQGPSIHATVYSDALSKVPRCGQNYNHAQLKGLFIEGVQASIRHSMPAY